MVIFTRGDLMGYIDDDPILDIKQLNSLSSTEVNLLFLIIGTAKNSKQNPIRLNYSELQDLSDYKINTKKLFFQNIEKLFSKLLNLDLITENCNGLILERFKMFTRFKIDTSCSHPYVEIEAYPNAFTLIDNFEPWIFDSIQVFLTLKSGYSKTMYRLLKKVSNNNSLYFSKDEFSKQLDIPYSYKQGDIDRAVLKPIREELTPLFNKLEISKDYSSRKGTPVIGYYIDFNK